MNPSVGFLGCGNMGTALLSALLQSGLVESSNVTVCNRMAEKNARLAEDYEVQTTENIEDLASGDILILGIKPQQLESIEIEMMGSPLVISMLAGTSLETLQKKFPTARVVRIMPNLGLYVGEGITGIVYGEGMTAEDMAFVQNMTAASGEYMEFDSEEQLDKFTAVAGSGPGFTFAFAENLAKAAEDMGFSPENADFMVRQMMVGSACILAAFPEDSFADWRKKVTSPGGMTEAGLEIWEQEKLGSSLGKVVTAGFERAKKLSETS